MDSLISSHTATKRGVPMQVLVLGLCRTGTQSLASALELLGIGPIYHMKHVAKSGHAKPWIQAYEIKYEDKRDAGSLDVEFFDGMLGEYAGVSDIPTASFAKELMLAYPDAKIILTTRSPAAAWVASMKSTIIHAHQARLASPDYDASSPSPPMLRLAIKYHSHHIWGGDAIEKNSGGGSGGEEAVLKRHDESVLAAAGALGRDVLVYEVKDGWGRLCEFLGVDGMMVDGVAFPRVDNWAEYKTRVTE